MDLIWFEGTKPELTPFEDIKIGDWFVVIRKLDDDHSANILYRRMSEQEQSEFFPGEELDEGEIAVRAFRHLCIDTTLTISDNRLDDALRDVREQTFRIAGTVFDHGILSDEHDEVSILQEDQAFKLLCHISKAAAKLVEFRDQNQDICYMGYDAGELVRLRAYIEGIGADVWANLN